MIYNKEQVKSIIPHRDPMLLIDSVESLEPKTTIRTKFYVDGDREIFCGHFPDAPVLPGVYTVECMAQTAGVLLLLMDRYKGKTPLFVGINNVHFYKKVLPGDTIEVQASMLKENVNKAVAVCKAEAFCGDDLVADGEVALAMR